MTMFKVLILSSLFGAVTCSQVLHRRWDNGVTATGTTDPDVVSPCYYYANNISSTDICGSLEAYFGITFTQLHAWNPSLLEYYCVLIEGWSYCVDSPAVTTTWTTSTIFTTSTSVSTTSTTHTATVTTSHIAIGDVPSPTQSGLISTCDAYFEVQSIDTCYTIQDIYSNFTLSQFYTWNPSITTGCKGLEANYYVCIGVPTGASTATSTSPYSPQQTGTASNCDEYYLVADGYNCNAILSEYDITIAQFYSWNPSVGSDCNSMEYGYYYCVGVSGSSSTATVLVTSTNSAKFTTSTTTSTSYPTGSGTVSTCDKYYLVKSGDTCSAIMSEHDITIAQFYSWNPSVGSSCNHMNADEYYCVGISGSTTITTTTKTTATSTKTTSTSTTSTGIGPTQTGIASNCVTYYETQSGDSCWEIVTEKYPYLNETLFIEWNPAVGSSCSILSGYYYCVATTDAQPLPNIISSCTSYHLVESGDSCWSIETAYGISVEEFVSWNPNVKSDCSGLWADYFVCVGI